MTSIEIKQEHTGCDSLMMPINVAITSSQWILAPLVAVLFYCSKCRTTIVHAGKMDLQQTSDVGIETRQ